MDIDILKKAKLGDEKSLSDVLIKLDPMVNKLCRNVFIRGYEFDDLKSLAKISILNAIKSFNVEGNYPFEPYVYVAIKNNMNNEIRKTVKHKDVLSLNFKLNNEDMEAIELLSNDETLEEYEDRKLFGLRLNEYLQSLTSKDQELLGGFLLNKRGFIKDYALKYNEDYFRCRRRKEKLLKCLINHLSG